MPKILIKRIFYPDIKKAFKRALLAFGLFLFIGTAYVNMVGQDFELNMPVARATSKNWDSESFWHPWGNSRVHKGIDIFAPQKTPILAPFNGILLSSGYSENGGNYLYVLGPKFRVYYFAHLNEKGTSSLFIKKGEQIGTVGNSGNAVGKPYHLHFSIYSVLPIFHNYSYHEQQGWMKMFYLNPTKSIKVS